MVMEIDREFFKLEEGEEIGMKNTKLLEAYLLLTDTRHTMPSFNRNGDDGAEIVLVDYHENGNSMLDGLKELGLVEGKDIFTEEHAQNGTIIRLKGDALTTKFTGNLAVATLAQVGVEAMVKRQPTQPENFIDEGPHPLPGEEGPFR